MELSLSLSLKLMSEETAPLSLLVLVLETFIGFGVSGLEFSCWLQRLPLFREAVDVAVRSLVVLIAGRI